MILLSRPNLTTQIKGKSIFALTLDHSFSSRVLKLAALSFGTSS
jgi:hypothetical protein